MIGNLKPTCDRKTRFWSNQRNTFGLLPGLEATCPGATTAPGGCWHIAPGKKLPCCYVSSTLSAYKNVHGVLAHNTQLLMSAQKWQMIELLDDEFGRFRAAELRHRKKVSTDGARPMYTPYRLHWSGDIFSQTYAEALAAAIQLNSDIHFWCYTRSFFAVPTLCNIPNLTLYISLDPVNAQRGLSVFAENKNDQNNLQICYMNNENDFDDHRLRARQILDSENELRKRCGYPSKEEWLDGVPVRECPVDTKKLALEGGCAKCKQCFGKNPQAVWFKT